MSEHDTASKKNYRDKYIKLKNKARATRLQIKAVCAKDMGPFDLSDRFGGVPGYLDLQYNTNGEFEFKESSPQSTRPVRGQVSQQPGYKKKKNKKDGPAK